MVGSNLRIKSLFDFTLSISLLLIFLPLIVLISVLIKLLMPGPVFFIQRRIGKGGREFKLIKFRTMQGSPRYCNGNFEAGDASRITSLGRILRRTKIDEIPQLLNVISGDMSIVGPRPEVKKWTLVYPERWLIVHSVKPGITDNASIEFRNEEELLFGSKDPEKIYREIILPKKLDLNEYYVENNSFFGDMKIIYRTIVSVLFK